jgi:hypothetical protein
LTLRRSKAFNHPILFFTNVINAAHSLRACACSFYSKCLSSHRYAQPSCVAVSLNTIDYHSITGIHHEINAQRLGKVCGRGFEQARAMSCHGACVGLVVEAGSTQT